MRYFNLEIDEKVKLYTDWNRKGVELDYRPSIVPHPLLRGWTAKVHDIFLELSITEQEDEKKNVVYMIDAYYLSTFGTNQTKFILLPDFENMTPLKSFEEAQVVALKFVHFYAKRFFCVYHPAELFLIEAEK